MMFSICVSKCTYETICQYRREHSFDQVTRLRWVKQNTFRIRFGPQSSHITYTLYGTRVAS